MMTNEVGGKDKVGDRNYGIGGRKNGLRGREKKARSNKQRSKEQSLWGHASFSLGKKQKGALVLATTKR